MLTFFAFYAIIHQMILPKPRGDAMNTFWKRTWAEINLDNLVYNFNTVKSTVANTTKVCCVIKADAYGHHAPTVAKTLENAGADWFAVSNIEEALQLRKSGITLPILILGYTPVECAAILADNNISQCIYSYDYATEMSKAAIKLNSKIKIHIKIDTGMGRLGFQCDEAGNYRDEIQKTCELDSLIPEGIFTHFTSADEGESGKEFTENQYKKFSNTIDLLKKRGICFEYKHCANSAATIDHTKYHMNMVRAGIVLYGLSPSDQVLSPLKFKPVMSLKTIVSHIKEVDEGATLSYGRTFVAKKKTKIATVPLGYADGFLRASGRNGFQLSVRGQLVSIAGLICMDQLMLDLTDTPAEVGDAVLFFENIKTCAAALGTIPYELFTGIGPRVVRIARNERNINS